MNESRLLSKHVTRQHFSSAYRILRGIITFKMKRNVSDHQPFESRIYRTHWKVAVITNTLTYYNFICKEQSRTPILSYHVIPVGICSFQGIVAELEARLHWCDGFVGKLLNIALIVGDTRNVPRIKLPNTPSSPYHISVLILVTSPS